MIKYCKVCGRPTATCVCGTIPHVDSPEPEEAPAEDENA